jgi:hypothetical protein
MYLSFLCIVYGRLPASQHEVVLVFESAQNYIYDSWAS